MTEDITIRPAEPADLAAVAGLRWQWMAEHGDTPTTLERPEFIRHFVAWAAENSSSHRCTVLVRDSVVIGMTWLAVVHRVPTPRALHRASGDLQCVYVAPEARDTGLGSRLITETLAAAAALGLERVTVHSSPRAIPAYARQGFENSPRLLQTHLEAVAGIEPA
ncbi:GNAT family N-acetyltransferase [Streptomyces cinnabarinus]|uniref:GNAT family N-acetyltransferase n=1 Tax=Streptomyces cinnabarinus TaxID=67287 RepID=A0ABY7KEP9_9ACTN|nr:GNAT family N-acetyltransferase [Streptomyces cinnabarinus]WAZ22070.1 GNAT family N-acetyltransferase [Streptomyces cinnabarinus]